jgi:hypothetical protein
MILADELKTLTTYRAPELTRMAKESGYTGPAFSSCKFLGITNGGQFAYQAVFPVKNGTDSTKVFLSYDHAEDRVYADVQLQEIL